MYKQALAKIKKKTEKQFKSIRDMECYKDVKANFEIEYQVAMELAQARKGKCEVYEF